MRVMDKSETCTSVACVLPLEDGRGCGCDATTDTSGKTNEKIAKTATVSALAAVACTSCCVLPFLLPAVVLANIGGLIAILDHAHVWVTRGAMFVVACAWILIGFQTGIAQKRPSRSAVLWMTLATIMAVAAASWPTLKPLVFHVFGFVKKIGD